MFLIYCTTSNVTRLLFLPSRMDLLDDPANPNIIALLELPGISRQEIQLRIGQDGNLLVYGQRLASPFLKTIKAGAVPLNPVHSTKNGSVSRTSSTQNLTIDTSSPSSASASSSTILFGPDHASHLKVQEIKYGQYQRSIPLPLGTQVRRKNYYCYLSLWFLFCYPFLRHTCRLFIHTNEIFLKFYFSSRLTLKLPSRTVCCV